MKIYKKYNIQETVKSECDFEPRLLHYMIKMDLLEMGVPVNNVNLLDVSCNSDYNVDYGMIDVYIDEEHVVVQYEGVDDYDYDY